METEKAVVDTKITGACNSTGQDVRPSRSFPQMSDLNLYTLLSSDTSGALLIQLKLKADNYDQCSSASLDSLKAKRKECFVDGTMNPPSRDSLDYADWGTMNTLIVLWIFAMLDSSFLPYVSYKDNAKAFWDMLKQRFFAGNGHIKYKLEGVLMNCKQQGYLVVEYFGNLTKCGTNWQTTRSL